MRKVKGYVDPEHIRICDEFKDAVRPVASATVTISILGIRNLIKPALKPKMIIRLTNNPDEEKVVKMDEKWREQ